MIKKLPAPLVHSQRSLQSIITPRWSAQNVGMKNEEEEGDNCAEIGFRIGRYLDGKTSILPWCESKRRE